MQNLFKKYSGQKKIKIIQVQKHYQHEEIIFTYLDEMM